MFIKLSLELQQTRKSKEGRGRGEERRATRLHFYDVPLLIGLIAVADTGPINLLI